MDKFISILSGLILVLAAVFLIKDSPQDIFETFVAISAFVMGGFLLIVSFSKKKL